MNFKVSDVLRQNLSDFIETDVKVSCSKNPLPNTRETILSKVSCLKSNDQLNVMLLRSGSDQIKISMQCSSPQHLQIILLLAITINNS